MAITIRIVVHELEQRFGRVRLGSAAPKRQCSDVRILSDGPLDERMLYIADAARLESLSLTPAERSLVLAVGADVSEAQAGLALSTGCAPVEVFSYLQDVFTRYRTWLERMDRSIIRNDGLQKLFDLSEGFLLNNVIVVDPALKLLAYTKGIPCDDPITVELIKHGYHTEGNIKKFQLNQRFKPWAEQNGFIINDSKTICRYTTAVFSFKAAESFSLIVVMMCNNAAPEPWLLDTFILFLIRVAFYSMRDYRDGTPSGSAFNAFIHDILDESLVNEDEIEERRRYLGLPAEGPYCLFVIDIGEEQHLAARIVTDVARNIAPAKAMVHGSDIVVLCFSCASELGAKRCDGICPPATRGILDRLDETLAEYDLHAGKSSAFDKLTLLPTALEQAKRALQTGISFTGAHGGTEEHPDRRVFDFDDFFFEYLVMNASKGRRELLTSLRSCRQLAVLQAYDAKHNTDNYRFLRYYLRFERRTTLVAEKLHMHRNNVKYRADRLNELFGIDTDDERERFELGIAYRILDALER